MKKAGAMRYQLNSSMGTGHSQWAIGHYTVFF